MFSMERAQPVKHPDAEQLTKVLTFINTERGIDLCSYRQNFSFRHLRSRFVETKAGNAAGYIAYIKVHPEEIDRFLDELSINVTHFFRDIEVFEAFRKGPLQDVLQRKLQGGEGRLIRIWSAACASGQEPYSLAIMLAEEIQGNAAATVRILATDVDADALERAKAGVYDQRQVKEVNKKLLEKYFHSDYNGTYSVSDQIKRMVRFERHNLITDPGFKSIDFIFCRNVMIYFNRQQQDNLIRKFHASLNSGGYLVTAKVESVWSKDLFMTKDAYNKIYQRAN